MITGYHHIESNVAPGFDPENVVETGVFTCGDLACDYTLRQPSPSQWIAVGVVSANPSAECVFRPRMLVGRGSDERKAIRNLEREFQALTRGAQLVG